MVPCPLQVTLASPPSGLTHQDLILSYSFPLQLDTKLHPAPMKQQALVCGIWIIEASVNRITSHTKFLDGWVLKNKRRKYWSYYLSRIPTEVIESFAWVTSSKLCTGPGAHSGFKLCHFSDYKSKSRLAHKISLCPFLLQTSRLLPDSAGNCWDSYKSPV